MLNLPNIPDQYQNRLRIGTCSWKYDSWKEIIYQDRRYGPYDYLKDYVNVNNHYEGCALLTIERFLAAH
ncbi:hypothetical protein ACFL6U_01600 [Planctomycetota bacterium]